MSVVRMLWLLAASVSWFILASPCHHLKPDRRPWHAWSFLSQPVLAAMHVKAKMQTVLQFECCLFDSRSLAIMDHAFVSSVSFSFDVLLLHRFKLCVSAFHGFGS